MIVKRLPRQSAGFVKNDLVDLHSHMGRGVYTAAGKNAVISDKEQMSLHDGLLGGMCEQQRNELRNNPNLNPVRFPGPLTRAQRERQYVAILAQNREDMIVTREIERQLAMVAAGHVSAGATGFF